MQLSPLGNVAGRRSVLEYTRAGLGVMVVAIRQNRHAWMVMCYLISPSSWKLGCGEGKGWASMSPRDIKVSLSMATVSEASLLRHFSRIS